jgi:hypothetical protein
MNLLARQRFFRAQFFGQVRNGSPNPLITKNIMAKATQIGQKFVLGVGGQGVNEVTEQFHFGFDGSIVGTGAAWVVYSRPRLRWSGGEANQDTVFKPEHGGQALAKGVLRLTPTMSIGVWLGAFHRHHVMRFAEQPSDHGVSSLVNTGGKEFGFLQRQAFLHCHFLKIAQILLVLALGFLDLGGNHSRRECYPRPAADFSPGTILFTIEKAFIYISREDGIVGRDGLVCISRVLSDDGD